MLIPKCGVTVGPALRIVDPGTWCWCPHPWLAITCHCHYLLIILMIFLCESLTSQPYLCWLTSASSSADLSTLPCSPDQCLFSWSFIIKMFSNVSLLMWPKNGVCFFLIVAYNVLIWLAFFQTIIISYFGCSVYLHHSPQKSHLLCLQVLP